ncbi:MAG: class IV adenylate cyclase [Anaerolineaceae bacterium]|nr:class IV adenylate cyclase [Anaerolineaceae bacterium]
MKSFIEQEAKFRISDPLGIRIRLEQMGAELVLDHQQEVNTRFDQPDGSMKTAHEVLRLRVDQNVRLTYKGPAVEGTEVSVRKEIEMVVDNAETATAFLESLGYKAIEKYEKFRTTYHLEDTEIVLDELPYGHFLEIEGQNEEDIRQIAEVLKLDWEKRCKLSYLELFYRIKEKRGLDHNHLSFADYFPCMATEDFLDAEIADIA